MNAEQRGRNIVSFQNAENLYKKRNEHKFIRIFNDNLVTEWSQLPKTFRNLRFTKELKDPVDSNNGEVHTVCNVNEDAVLKIYFHHISENIADFILENEISMLASAKSFGPRVYMVVSFTYHYSENEEFHDNLRQICGNNTMTEVENVFGDVDDHCAACDYVSVNAIIMSRWKYCAKEMGLLPKHLRDQFIEQVDTMTCLGVVHGDLFPRNYLISSDHQHLRICDFNLSFFANLDGDKTNVTYYPIPMYSIINHHNCTKGWKNALKALQITDADIEKNNLLLNEVMKWISLEYYFEKDEKDEKDDKD